MNLSLEHLNVFTFFESTDPKNDGTQNTKMISSNSATGAKINGFKSKRYPKYTTIYRHRYHSIKIIKGYAYIDTQQ